MTDSLNLGGTSIRVPNAATAGGIFLELVKGYYEPPEVRGVDTDIPGTDGRISRNRKYVRRSIVLEGWVKGISASDWASKTAALMALLDPKTPNTLTVANSYLGTSGSHSTTVRVINVVGGPPMLGPTFQTWSIELESIVPGWS